MPVSRVVIGVIDSGIAFAHMRFRNQGGTRISNLWRQDFMGGPGPFTPGVQLNAGGINTAIGAAGGDEDAVYRSIGGLGFTTGGFKPLARRRSHGTHVLDLAAGDDPAANVTDRPIIAVDIPDVAVGDPAGSTLTIHAFLGLLHIMREAQAIPLQPNETLPVVVNLSYGPHEGPHDGTGLLEQIMDFMVRIYRTSSTPLKIVLAAGNYRQRRIHAQFNVLGGANTRMHWRLQPCSLSASLMEIWFAGAGAQATVTLTSPLGQIISVSPTNPVDRLTNAANEILMLAQFLSSPSTGRSCVVLSIARTDFDPAGSWGQAIVPSGAWTVDVTNNGNGPVTFDAWIKRSDTPPGHPARGRQSYFEDAGIYQQRRPNGCPEEFDRGSASQIVRAGTLSGIATGVHTEIIGGYRRGDNRNDLHPAPYSSAGPHFNSTRPRSAPDWVEVSDDSIACAGVRAAGTRSGSSVAMDGTSVAAPRAVRWIASQWLNTGVQPNRPPLVPPKANPLNPIPPAEVIRVVGGGLHLTPQRRGRPS